MNRPEPDLALPAIAHHQAALLAGLAVPATAELVRHTALLLAGARLQGHGCVRLREHERTAVVAGAAPLPAATAWAEGLGHSGVCGDGTADTPLVLAGDRLYTLRNFRCEQRIVAWVRQRLALPPRHAPHEIAAAMAGIAAPGTAAAPDWQAVAVFAAARSSLLLLTGGPGTGKTTTVARVLAVLERLQPGLRAALCAPTGKAAARLQQAIDERARALGAPGRGAGGATQTLHRLLGYLPIDDAFRHGPQQPLPWDVVVVDEASMVDLALFDALLWALRPGARLLAVGDQDQLASIATGQPFGDLCRAAAPGLGVGTGLAAAWSAAFGSDLPAHDAPLADVTVALRTNHRFAEQPGIGAFAQSLQARAGAPALAALQAGHPDLALRPPRDADAIAQELQPRAAGVITAAGPAEALAALQTWRVLCATRSGPAGALAWNRRIEALLQAAGHRVSGPWYHGRPVLISANDPQTRLFNGDLGVVWHDPDGREQVWFAEGDTLRAVAPLRLPAHETAWAMTVHKAQGSEFAEVLLVMPERDGPLWQASLVYTGVTRARRRATVVADPGLLAPALDRWPQRASGLAAALRPAP